MTSPHGLACAGANAGQPMAPPRRGLAGVTTDADCPVAQPLSRDVACHGYVGQGARVACEYHECDFDWHEHAATVRHIVEAQQAQALAIRLQQTADNKLRNTAEMLSASMREQVQDNQQPASQPAPLLEGGSESVSGSSSQLTFASASGAGSVSGHSLAHQPPQPQLQPQPPWERTASPASCASAGIDVGSAAPNGVNAENDTRVGRPSALRSGGTGSSSGRSSSSSSSGGAADEAGPASRVYEGERWEEFYRAHPTARFFKERRYLLLEFPELVRAEHVAEIGCGCGSSILPVLKANAAAQTTCTDISTTCLDQLREAAAAEGIAPSRIRVFPADATDPAAAPVFHGIDADALLIMFTLSAVTPAQQYVMLSHAWRALRPGGRLMLRDHGLYDMVQLRIPASQWIGTNLYKRGDGTMAYFFSTEELTSRAEAAGFSTVECKYVTVVNRNRKTGVELRRVFVHGVFEKPATITV